MSGHHDNNPNHAHSYNPNSIDAKLAELITLQKADKEDRDKWREEFTKRITSVDERLKSVEFQTKQTNGRVLKSEEEIIKLQQMNELEQATKEEIIAIIETKKFVNKWLINKWFVVFLIIIIAGVIKVASSPWLQAFLRSLSGV